MNRAEYARMFEVEDRHWWYVGLHELVLETVLGEARRRGRPLDVLDAGCGTGRLCELLGRERQRVTGCDLSGEAIGRCRQRGLSAVFQADLNALGLAPGSFDVVTSIDVLYHADVRDDVAVMRRLWECLRPGGLLVLNLVAHEFLRSSHDVAVHTRERYTRGTLCDRVRAAGFGVEMATYRLGLLFPLVAAHRLASRLLLRRGTPAEAVRSDVAMPPARLNALLLAAIRAENLLLRRTALPVGSSVFVVARKPGTPPAGPRTGGPP